MDREVLCESLIVWVRIFFLFYIKLSLDIMLRYKKWEGVSMFCRLTFHINLSTQTTAHRFPKLQDLLWSHLLLPKKKALKSA